MKPLVRTIPSLVALLCIAAPAMAQLPSTPRALGVGGAYIGMARGHEAVLLNPANLGLRDNPWWSLAFPQFGIGASVAGASLADYSDFTSGSSLPESRRRELLDAVSDEGAEIILDTRLPLFAMQNRGFGLAVTFNSIGDHTLGKDLIDLYLNQYQEGRTDYSVGNTAGRRASFLDVAAAYGRQFGPVNLGMAVHYYHGFNLVHSRMFEPRFDLQASDLEIDYVGVLVRGGRGFGVDFGVTYQPVPTVTLGAAVANAATRMTWSEELYVRHATYTRADFGTRDPFPLLTRYEQSEQRLTDEGSAQVRRTAIGLYDEAYFPTTLRTGVAVDLPTRTQLGAAFQTNLTDGRLAGRWDQMLSVGVQQATPIVSLRAGYGTNLDGGSVVSGGLSLAALEFGLARYRGGDFHDTQRQGIIATLGVNVRTKTLRP
jgi:hypothetical protein